MKQSKLRRKLALLMVVILLFAGLGTSAFAAKPPKTPTLEIVEPSLNVLSGETVSTELIVSNPGEAFPIIVSAPIEGYAEITIISDKRNQDKYEFTYTDQNAYLNEGTEIVEIALSGDEANIQTITITIQGTAVNEPPELVNAPEIISTFVVGTYAEPVLGEWVDIDSASFTVTRTWELTYGTEEQSISVDGNLFLEPEWEGLSIQLKEVATDSDGASNEASSTPQLITSPSNQPPTLVSAPDIIGTFVTETYATPVFGEWEDLDSASFAVVRTWLLDGVPLTEDPADGELYLDSSWAGKSLVLKEVATDSDGVSNEASSAPQVITTPAQENLLYVALGDSIATGTVAPSMPNETPYIHAFRSYLAKETGRTVDMSDFSEDGDHTGHLLARLGGPAYDGVGADQTMINQVSAADVITLSIGGNNLMSAAKYTTYVFFFFKVDYYDFDRIDTDKADAGLEAFQEEFPLIIQRIRQYNSKAKIIVNDLYNPFNKTMDVGTTFEGNYNLVESYFHRSGAGVNDVIRDECNSHSGVEYAEVYAAFENYGGGDKKEQITYMYISDTYFGFELRNPHPNTMGQSLIEAAVETAYDLLP